MCIAFVCLGLGGLLLLQRVIAGGVDTGATAHRVLPRQQPLLRQSPAGSARAATQDFARPSHSSLPLLVASPRATPAPPVAPSPPPAAAEGLKHILVFTMDTISSYGEAAGKGGPAGEILVTSCLVAALQHLGVKVTVASSDLEFAAAGRRIEDFDGVVLDPWTVFGPGYKPRPFLVGRESTTWILDFFGAPGLGHGGLGISPSHLLTAYDTPPWNTYLGFFLPPSQGVSLIHALSQGDLGMRQDGWRRVDGGWERPKKQASANRAGVLWGKKESYFASEFASGAVPLAANVGRGVVTTAVSVPRHLLQLASQGKLHRTGHLTPPAWFQLLQNSSYLLGLGDPLAGPSALEAIAAGAGYIDVLYRHGVGAQGVYTSQHPFVQAHVPASHVCVAQQADPSSVLPCVQRFSAASLPGFIPHAVSPSAYLLRVKAIFGDLLV